MLAKRNGEDNGMWGGRGIKSKRMLRCRGREEGGDYDISRSPQTSRCLCALYAPARTSQNNQEHIKKDAANKERIIAFQRQETGLSSKIIQRQRS